MVASAICTILLATAWPTAGFGAHNTPRLSLFRPFPRLFSTVTTTSPTPASVATPSWEELSRRLDSGQASEPLPLVTLYRDTNGWCPFCERVWVALRAKGIPYAEQVVSLQNKPEWYKALVPTALVPAVLFHGDGDSTERSIIWESDDILRALDERFDDTPRLMSDGPEFVAARDMNNDLTAAGFAFVYAARNDTLTEEDRAARRVAFEAEIDRLDAALTAGGPFRLGSEFTGMDAIIVPTLERWRYQLPLTAQLDILAGRPGICRWFEAMEAFAPYSERVEGDAYSWTATNAMFLRYFGGGDERPEVAAAIAKSDEAADSLATAFAAQLETADSGAGPRREAAAKVVTNHAAVVEDCTREDPLSQKHFPRATAAVEGVDVVLRHAASVLLSGEDVVEAAQKGPLPELPEGESRTAAALAARTVAKRLCVPRDMGAPSARVLRGVLATLADRLEKE